MIQLLPLMLERVGILVIFAFLLSRVQMFRALFEKDFEWKEKFFLICIFGMFGIISNYTGVEILMGNITTHTWQTELEINSALANTRIMGVAIGGLVGGPLVGLGVGLIAGIHRFTLGGFTAIACGLSTIFAGVATGIIGRKNNIQHHFTRKAIIIGISMEIVQMIFILVFAKPLENAFELVQIIAIPMIIINALGMLIFLFIIQNILQEEEKTRAAQTHLALDIAQQTLAYFRQGLNPDSCRHVAQLILDATTADAISITNKSLVLAHVGLGKDHHVALSNTSTILTKKVIQEGRIITANKQAEILCPHPDCPLQAAIVLPLKAHNKVVGTLKLYFANPKKRRKVEYKLAEGLSRLFSTQLELAEAELQQKMLKDAEIKALQAQIHPHFLFNSMNTISSLIRIDAEKARKMVQNLSVFFRNNLQASNCTYVSLHQEIEHVEAFLELEQARFPEKFTIEFHLEESIKKMLIPPFILQPLVENATRHAFTKGITGIISIKAICDHGQLVLITEDNGKGMSEDLLLIIGNKTVMSAKGNGTALWNINKRIKEIYGDKGTFLIESEINRGTKITIILPLTDETKWREYA